MALTWLMWFMGSRKELGWSHRLHPRNIRSLCKALMSVGRPSRCDQPQVPPVWSTASSWAGAQKRPYIVLIKCWWRYYIYRQLKELDGEPKRISQNGGLDPRRDKWERRKEMRLPHFPGAVFRASVDSSSTVATAPGIKEATIITHSSVLPMQPTAPGWGNCWKQERAGALILIFSTNTAAAYVFEDLLCPSLIHPLSGPQLLLGQAILVRWWRPLQPRTEMSHEHSGCRNSKSNFERDVMCNVGMA